MNRSYLVGATNKLEKSKNVKTKGSHKISFWLPEYLSVRKQFRRFILKTFYTIALLLPLSLLGQTPNTANNGFMRTDLISPSPTAANLSRYGNVPLTYYTGLPNISIPIFNVEGSDLNLPITLTYNYNGFKPSEEASWVGLGWSLQAGGVITRTLGDKVDEDFIGQYKYEKTVDLQEVSSQTYLDLAYRNAMYDLQPDVFNFNFGNYSGKFVLYNGQAYVMPSQKIKISGNTGGFTITTEDGTKYEFMEQEVSMNKSTGYEPYIIPAYKSSWYLTRITNASNTEGIRLEYSTEGPIYQYGMVTQSYSQYISGSVSGQNGLSYITSTISGAGASFSTKVQTAKRLSAIHSEKYSVYFTEGEVSRGDIDGASWPLSSIAVYSSDNKIIKKFQFETEYFGTGNTHSTRYLKLKRLKQFDYTDNFIEHEFEYENESSFYANAYSSYIDHYGYLKSPSVMPGSPSIYFPNNIFLGGPNRDPVFSSTKQGALKKIIYPTGGTSELEYELNTYNDGKNYTYSYITNSANRMVLGQPVVVVEKVDTFSTNYDQQVSLYMSRVPRITPTEGVVEVDHSSVYEVRLERIYYVDGIEDYYEPIGTYKIEYNSENTGKNVSIQLAAGAYRITTRCDPTESSVSASISGNKRFVTGVIEGKGGAGIRLKKITENPIIGIPIVRQYSYVDNEGFSTGKGLGEPSYTSMLFTRTVKDGGLTPIGTVQMMDHTSVVSESPEIGLPFYYKTVTEDLISGGVISRTKYYFDHIPGFNDADLTKQVDYKMVGSSFTPVRKIENTYTNKTLDVFAGISIYRTEEITIEGASPGGPELIYAYNPTAQYVLWKYLKSAREIQYSDVDSLVTLSENFYDGSTRNLIGLRKTNLDSSGYYTKYKYPEDYVSSIGSALVSANMLATKIEEQVWKKKNSIDSVFIAGKINQFNSLKKIEKIYSFESEAGLSSLPQEGPKPYANILSDNHYESKIDFTYSASGKVIGQQLTNDAPASYLWAYPTNVYSGSLVPWYNYPIAEIKNALSTEVFYTSFESTGTLQESKTGTMSYSGVYQISGSYTGVYILTYWKKTGSNPWQLITGNYTNPTNLQIGDANSIIDEVRLYPEKALLTTYTYKNGFGLSSVNDANNNISFYEYDSFVRLKLIKDDKGNILKHYKYNYKNEGHAGEGYVE